MNKLIEYLNTKPISDKAIKKLLKEEIKTLIDNDYNFENSIFEKHPAEIKILFQTNKKLFWDFWEYCEKKQSTLNSKKEDSEILNRLRKDGICILPNYFKKKDLTKLKNDWSTSIQNMPELNKEEQLNLMENRFNFAVKDNIRYVTGSKYDGKERVIYTRYKTFPKNFQILLNENKDFKNIIQDYFYINKEIFASAIMAEKLISPKYERNDLYWHIDNLSDQFKVMIILKDMNEKDGPFIYKKGTHVIKNKYKNRYHKMYSINGIATQETNHFEEDFTKNKKLEKAILKAGDVVLFDCKIHHSASFVKDKGMRENLVMYFNSVPTIKNNILHKIDSYLNFALK